MTIIIGAGLSGLLIAYRLKKEGLPFKILEARERIGGRIHTMYGTNDTPIEMGATWFTQQHNHLIELLKELDIDPFEQAMGSTAFFQSSSTSPVQSIQIPPQSPSYRISGGTSNLIYTLYQKLDKKDIIFNQSVKEIVYFKNCIKVIAEEVYEGDNVVLALPPKLWAYKINFKPQLPDHLMQVAKSTHTWMEDSIKVALIYNRPFWKEENLPSTLFSSAGPITEFYDHCNHERSKFALCGFIHSSFKNLSKEDRFIEVIHQLKTVFGPTAETFIDYKEFIWSDDPNTFEKSAPLLMPHQNNGHPVFRASFFDDKLLISSSESADTFPGYLDGAVSSANSVARKLIELRQNY